MNSPEDASSASPARVWIRRIAILLMSIGGAGFAAAVAWWFMFFRQMLGTDVKTASECFYSTTLGCKVANVVGSFMETSAYDPRFLWATMTVAIIGFLVYAFIPES